MTYKKITRRIFVERGAMAIAGGLGLLNTVVVTPALAQSTGDNETLKIGLIVDMSGPYSDLTGTGSVAAVSMAIDDFGGELFDRPIELLSADHQNKPDLAASIARKWFDKENVSMIADVAGSPTALAVINLAAQNDKVITVSGPAASSITGKYCTPVSMHWSPDTHALTFGAVRGLIDNGKNKKWFLIAADNEFGKQFEVDIRRALDEVDGELVNVVRHPLGTTDFASFMLQAQGSSADVIALGNAGTDTISAIKSAQEFQLLDNFIVMPLFMLPNDVHSVGLDVAQGMTLVDGFYWDSNKKTREWAKRFYTRENKMPNWVNAAEYSSVLHYLRNAQAVGTLDADKIVEKMKGTLVNDVYADDAKVRIDGRLINDLQLVRVKKPEESSDEWDMYNVMGSIDGDNIYTKLSDSECDLIK